MKLGGVCWIAEVRSRFDGSAGHASVESFLAACERLGFKRKGAPDESNKMFFVVKLVKSEKRRKGDPNWPKLKACIYKRR